MLEAKRHIETDEPQDFVNFTVLIIRGIPGSGKSYLSHALQEFIGKETVEVIDPDRIDRAGKEYKQFSQELSFNGVDIKFHPYRFLTSKTDEAIASKKVVIWDQPFIDFEGFEITVEKLHEIATRHGKQLITLLVEVEISKEVALKRVLRRKESGGHGPTPIIFERFANQYVSFAGKGYNTVTVRGEGKLSMLVSTIMDEVGKLWN